MIDTLALKKYIFDNEKIEYVLKEIGCHHIQYHPHKEYWSCGNHNGDNTNAINVKNNSYLNVVNWTRMKDFDDNADIITLVEYNIQCSFKEAVKYLHRILGLEYKWQKKHEKQEKKFDPLYIFKKVSCKNKVDVNDIHALDEELLDDYVPLLWYGWYKEGIMPWSREKFNIAYSYRKKESLYRYTTG